VCAAHFFWAVIATEHPVAVSPCSRWTQAWRHQRTILLFAESAQAMRQRLETEGRVGARSFQAGNDCTLNGRRCGYSIPRKRANGRRSALQEEHIGKGRREGPVRHFLRRDSELCRKLLCLRLNASCRRTPPTARLSGSFQQ
jgi:hypothetical protein